MLRRNGFCRGPILWAGAAWVVLATAAMAERGEHREGPDSNPHTRRDPARMLERMDADGDRKISREEFRGPPAFFDRLDTSEDGFLSAEELAAARRRRGHRDDDAPKVGESAPTFRLKSIDGKEAFDLARFRGKRPVVLIFGSYT